MKKAIYLVLIACLTLSSTIALAYYIGVKGFSFAWSLNMLLMGFALAFTEVLKSKHTSPFYHEKSWEQKGKIYELLGINAFRKLLVLIGWEALIRKSNPIEKNTKALLHLHYQTKQSELGHIIIFFIVLGFNIYAALQFGIVQSLWLLVLNILLNLYPIFLQRYNRPRLERAIKLSLHRGF